MCRRTRNPTTTVYSCAKVRSAATAHATNKVRASYKHSPHCSVAPQQAHSLLVERACSPGLPTGWSLRHGTQQSRCRRADAARLQAAADHPLQPCWAMGCVQSSMHQPRGVCLARPWCQNRPGEPAKPWRCSRRAWGVVVVWMDLVCLYRQVGSNRLYRGESSLSRGWLWTEARTLAHHGTVTADQPLVRRGQKDFFTKFQSRLSSLSISSSTAQRTQAGV